MALHKVFETSSYITIGIVIGIFGQFVYSKYYNKTEITTDEEVTMEPIDIKTENDDKDGEDGVVIEKKRKHRKHKKKTKKEKRSFFKSK